MVKSAYLNYDKYLLTRYQMAAFYSTYMSGKSSLCPNTCPIRHIWNIYFIFFQTYYYVHIWTHFMVWDKKYCHFWPKIQFLQTKADLQTQPTSLLGSMISHYRSSSIYNRRKFVWEQRPFAKEGFRLKICFDL